MPTQGNAINANTVGLVGFTGSEFTGSPATQFCVQIGGATSSTLANVTNGTNGQVLTANTGAAPTFQAPAGITGPGSSTDRALATWNGTGGTALFNNSTTKIDSTGRFTNSAQPVFSVYVPSGLSNVTGDGTTYTIPFSTALVNQGTYFNTSTGVFTAPVTGVYYFCASVQFNNVVAQSNAQLIILASGVTYVSNLINPSVIAVSAQMGLMAHCVAPMSANDTSVCQVIMAGSTKSVNISTGANSVFGGYLIC